MGIDRWGNEEHIALINEVCVLIYLCRNAALGAQHQGQNLVNGDEIALHLFVHHVAIESFTPERKLKSVRHNLFVFLQIYHFIAHLLPVLA